MTARTTLTKEIQFDAGHRVPAHTSKCMHPHGHRYRVVVEAEGPVPESGMIVDFGVLKQWMMEEIHDRYDHAMICGNTDHELIDAMSDNGWRYELVPHPPTAENLAAIFWDHLRDRLNEEPDLRIVSITVWETPTSSATHHVGTQ